MNRRMLALFLMLLIFSTFGHALANSAEPPGLTVIVSNPPDGLILTIESNDTVTLMPEHRFWEGQYRFCYGALSSDSQIDTSNAELVATWDQNTIRLPIPEEYFGYNRQITLDISNNELIHGQKALRAPLLIALRVLLTLILEGTVLFAFGYKTKHSIKVFLTLNLVTQTILNIIFSGANGYWFMLYILVEAVIFITEAHVCKRHLTEHSSRRAVFYSITANTASLILGGWMLSSLPV